MSWPTLNLVDIAAVIYIGFGAFRGAKRGLSGGLGRLIGLAVIVTAAWKGYELLGGKLGELTRLSAEGSRLAAFILLILLATVTMYLLRLVLKNILEFTFKNPLEWGGGIAAGAFQSGLLVAAVVIVANLTPSDYLRTKFGEESRIGSLVTQTLVPAYHQAVTDLELDLPKVPSGGSKKGTAVQKKPDPAEESKE